MVCAEFTDPFSSSVGPGAGNLHFGEELQTLLAWVTETRLTDMSEVRRARQMVYLRPVCSEIILKHIPQMI